MRKKRRKPGAFLGQRQVIRNLGPTVRRHCAACGQSSFWRLVESQQVFYLFFCPVRVLREEAMLRCGQCTETVAIEAQHFPALRDMNSLTGAFLSGELTSSDYDIQASRGEGLFASNEQGVRQG